MEKKKNATAGASHYPWAIWKTLKGQMNQKIDISSFVALPSPNTKKNHPKLDLSNDFSSQAFIIER